MSNLIKTVPTTLLEALETKLPLLPRPFPIKSLEKELAKLFDDASLSVSYEEAGWVEKENALEGMGEKPLLHSFLLSPLAPEAFMAIAAADLKNGLSALLGAQESPPVVDEALLSGFYRYFMLMLCSQIEALNPFSHLSPRVGAEQKSLDEPVYYVINARINTKSHSMMGRLLLGKGFSNAFSKHVAAHPLTFEELAAHEMGEKLLLEMALEAGSCDLSLAEWKKAQPGDFVVLDKCTFDPKTRKGRLILTVGGRPLFRAKVTDEGLQLLEYPFYEEVNKTMDDELDDDLFDEDEDAFDEEFEDDASFDDDDEEEEVLVADEELDLESEPPIDVELAKQEVAAEEAKDVEEVSKQTLSADAIPLRLTVEVGALKMSAKELLELKVGSLLKLDVHPEQGVDLTVGSKKIGRGELVQLGEVFGVRILSL